MESIIELKGASKRFADKTVLHNIDLNLPKGRVIGLLGPNGAGKTTLMQVMLGMLNLDSGESKLFSQNSWQLDAMAKAKIGYVPQQPAFFEWMSIEQSIQYQKSFYPSWDHNRVEALLDMWQLNGKEKIKNISLGQKQRLAIVHALAHQPELLILDEPVASLDPLARREFIQELIKLNLAQETTILFSTHIVSDLERVASDVVIINQGQLKYSGALDVLKEQVKKITIKASEQMPETSPFSSTLSYKAQGVFANAVVQGAADLELDKIKAQFNAELHAQDLDLEQIYMEIAQ
ncbi:ABC transporter ATP-binding protein [Catenovulum sp. SM1970]|uniref:ABC transporter ATP-binding protein n=1 Tax=Marinifaba aquimaris TaxID=2741323 RepID=UPI0015734255|nr:ABC transporter ATP-binding protein [Marinifaba aquimaris]NTS75741.1 ABC transporter ATP-binding protein [Marinifaba aquimaris]